MSTIEHECYIVRRTAAAVLVSDEAEAGEGNETWLPLSEIEIDMVNTGAKLGEARVSIPEWLAIEKDLA